LKFELFIARRIIRNRSATRKVAKPVLNISVWAISLGILIMILAISTGNGLRNAIKNKITGFGGDIQVLNYQPSPTYEQSPVLLSDSLLLSIKQRDEISLVQAYAQKAGILKSKDLFEGAVIKGVGPNYQWTFFKSFITEGKIPIFKATGYQDSVLISEKLASILDLSLGDNCEMYFIRPNKAPLRRKFTIGALFKTDFEEIDASFLIGDINHVSRLNNWRNNEVGGYEIFLVDKNDSEAISKNLRTLLPFEYDALTARQLNTQLFQWLDLFDLNIIIILIIIIAVATINMSIALLILIMERTTMIGLLKAMGATNFTIQKIFLLNASVLIGKGLLFGNLIGLGLAYLQQEFGFIKLDPETYYVSVVSVDINLMHIAGINLLTLAICLLCLLLPSYLISRIAPNKAIRFD
jgi:lipoprotein-releasing system permease protein